jgi:hypothetical protein
LLTRRSKQSGFPDADIGIDSVLFAYEESRLATTVDQITQRRRGVGLIAHDPALSAGGYTLIAPQTAAMST